MTKDTTSDDFIHIIMQTPYDKLHNLMIVLGAAVNRKYMAVILRYETNNHIADKCPQPGPKDELRLMLGISFLRGIRSAAE